MASRLLLPLRLLLMAAQAVWAHKLRSAFIILGVGLGISSLTLIVTSVDGANRMARDIVEMFGPDAAFVLGGNIQKRAVGMRTNTLTWTDAERIRQSLPGAYLVVPMRAQHNVAMRHEGRDHTVANVVGATANYATAWNWPLVEGRDISEEENARGARVCLIGFRPAQELFGDQSPVGRVVYIGNSPYQVIGQLAYRGSGGGPGHDIDDRVIIPLSTLTQRFNLDRKYFRALRVKFYDTENMAAHVENLRSLLRSLHGLGPDEEDDFTILTSDEVLNFLAMFKGSLLVFLGVTAGIAMLVGGFVLANLFSLSVSERAWEVGLRKALGARPTAILWQFLFEALMLTAVGGLVGLVIGLSLGQLLTRLDILTIEFSWKAFWMAMGGAMGTGLVFGLKPARTAARMDPIEAMRGGE